MASDCLEAHPLFVHDLYTGFIQAHRPKEKGVLMPVGCGSSAILRELRSYAEGP